MPEIEIRSATAQDSDLIIDMIRCMIIEMTAYGGHDINDSPNVWDSMKDLFKDNCLRQDHIYLIANIPIQAGETIGMAAAHIESLEELFASRPRLHLSAIYVIPAYRHQGAAKRMIKEVLGWGCRMGIYEAELNVLLANPARQFYESLGFQPSEVRMVKKLAGSVEK
jgi:GNAT superfamily N-acetyltransferase